MKLELEVKKLERRETKTDADGCLNSAGLSLDLCGGGCGDTGACCANGTGT